MFLFLSLSLLDLSVSLTRTNSLPADSLSACYAVAIYWLLHCGLLHGDPAPPHHSILRRARSDGTTNKSASARSYTSCTSIPAPTNVNSL
uniref:Putative secreted protein n=1 Tax=Anopheles marajoara TaxID=58244 RepID=A0A2M4C9Y5_9DIPT